MRVVVALLAAAGVFLIGAGRPAVVLVEKVGVYLRPVRSGREERAAVPRRLLRAGLAWDRRRLLVHMLYAGATGSVIGMLLAQGDLFVQGAGRSVPGLAILGGVAGVMVLNVWISGRGDRRARQLQHELPAVTDILALQILAGDSVTAALERFAESASGVAANELGAVLAHHHRGIDLTEALLQAARGTAYQEAGRLYRLLANAHQSGSRLADALLGLGVDYRASLTRSLTAEGGKRALATYGPILALMVPIALLFLIYPTLAGLNSLSAGP